MAVSAKFKLERPTLADVAKKVGVSTTTASAILNQRDGCFAGPAVRKRVVQAARELKYRPNSLARSLRRQTTQSWGTVFSDFFVDWIITLVRRINELSRQEGYYLLLEPLRTEATAPSDALNNLTERMVEGIFVVSPALPWRFEDTLYPPLVLVDCAEAENVPPHADYINIDRGAGISQAVKYLLRQGRKRIGLICGMRETEANLQKIRGWQEAHAEAGLTADPSLLFRSERKDEQSSAGGIALARRIGEEKIPLDALVGGNDYTGAGLVNTLMAAGVRVPDDVAVVSFNDSFFCGLMSPPLSSIRFPVEAMANCAVEMMLEQTRGDREGEPGRTMTFPTEFVPRASSG